MLLLAGGSPLVDRPQAVSCQLVTRDDPDLGPGRSPLAESLERLTMAAASLVEAPVPLAQPSALSAPSL
jgi:hypothetical protein